MSEERTAYATDKTFPTREEIGLDTPKPDRDTEVTPMQRHAVNIIAITRSDGSWGSYWSDESESFDEILAVGKPTPNNIANWFFPELARKHFLYVVRQD